MPEQTLCCAVVRDLAALYTDGQASPETAAAVRRHLLGCADCRRYYRSCSCSCRCCRPGVGAVAAPAPAAPADGYARLARRLRRRSAWERALYALGCALLAIGSFVAARLFGRRS